MADVSETLTSASSSTSVMGKEVDVQVYDSSSFTGTFAIQRKMGASWYVVSDFDGTDCEETQTALPYSRTIKSGKAQEIRVTITSYTTGTLGVEIR